MSSKKRKYREKISESTGNVLDLFEHPAFRSSVPAQDVTRRGDDDRPEIRLDDDDLADAPAAEPHPA
jgi:hypothetical protein